MISLLTYSRIEYSPSDTYTHYSAQ